MKTELFLKMVNKRKNICFVKTMRKLWNLKDYMVERLFNVLA